MHNFKLTKEQKDELKNSIKSGEHIFLSGLVFNIEFFKINDIYYITNDKYEQESRDSWTTEDMIKTNKYKSISESKFYHMLYKLKTRDYNSRQERNSTYD